MSRRTITHVNPDSGAGQGRQRRRAAALALAVVCATSLAGAWAQTISGAGTRECRAFNVAVERESQSALDSYLSWAQGFISGVNATNRRGINVSIDHAGLFHWLARYCITHREAMLYEALAELAGLQSP